jgi:hypothetical protein
MNDQSNHPCPICKRMIYIIGTNGKGKKVGSCGCTWKFRQTKSQKDMSRKYVVTEYGLELAPAEKKNE